MNDQTEFWLTFDHSEKKVSVVRKWELLGSHTVRQRDIEVMYNYSRECWEITQNFTRTYDIDDDGCLVSDDEYWSTEGKPWREYAISRHHKLLSLRFPYECGNKEPQSDMKDVAAELIEANY
jgi:hypothetical protein